MTEPWTLSDVFWTIAFTMVCILSQSEWWNFNVRSVRSYCSKKNSGADHIFSGEHSGPLDCYCPQKVSFSQPQTACLISYATFSPLSHMSNFDFQLSDILSNWKMSNWSMCSRPVTYNEWCQDFTFFPTFLNWIFTLPQWQPNVVGLSFSEISFLWVSFVNSLFIIKSKEL